MNAEHFVFVYMLTEHGDHNNERCTKSSYANRAESIPQNDSLLLYKHGGLFQVPNRICLGSYSPMPLSPRLLASQSLVLSLFRILAKTKRLSPHVNTWSNFHSLGPYIYSFCAALEYTPVAGSVRVVQILRSDFGLGSGGNIMIGLPAYCKPKVAPTYIHPSRSVFPGKTTSIPALSPL